MLIAQLSDIHIRPKGRLYKDLIDSAQRLRRAVAHINALQPRPEWVLLTGDLGDEEHMDELLHAREILDGLTMPLLALPGNHDDREQFRHCFADHAHLPRQGPLHFAVDAGAMRIVALDATVPGQHHGQIRGEDLAWLGATLQARPQQPTLLLMHHPPFVSGIGYLDAYRCFDTEGLEYLVRQHPQVQALLCGHVHRVMLRRWGGTLAFSAPSTATEIDLRLYPQARPASHAGPTGYALHRWDSAQGLVSHVVNLDEQDGPYPFF